MANPNPVQTPEFEKAFELDIDFMNGNQVDLFGTENKAIKIKSQNNQKATIFRRAKERMKEEVKKNLAPHIKPINASYIKDYIPKPDESTFCLMNGNCQFVDYISEFIKAIKTPVKEIYLTTLSLNDHSFDSLDEILPDIEKNILVSSYFLATDKANTLPKRKEDGRLEGYNIGFFRNHTKMVLIKTETDYYLFTGSANLRSSGTIEQFTIFNSKELYNFNKSWISELINKYNFKKKYSEIKNTGQANFYFMLDFEF